VSLEVRCQDQAEVDRYWEALTADGGEESQCGWLKDKYGLSWQIVPDRWIEFATGGDPGKVNAAMQAMLGMKKLDRGTGVRLQRGVSGAQALFANLTASSSSGDNACSHVHDVTFLA
jgi:hypothetical protein